jgi:peroxiredoxin
MSEPTQTMEGWYALHDFRTVEWSAWRDATNDQRAAALADWSAHTAWLREENTADKGSYGAFAIAGHKADLALVHFAATLQDLIDIKTRIAKTAMQRFLKPVYSYVSIVELSSQQARPDVDPHADPRLRSRLFPQFPEWPHICFYPMNKRRLPGENWYMLAREERGQLMMSHGMIGRTYAGKVTQIITGSVGFDDWEWGVTLFAPDPLQFKKLIYEMRFDEVSARYAEFGPFYVGTRLPGDRLQPLLGD